MASLSREIVVLILQFLKEENYMEAMHRLEKESGFFFNTEYFGEKFLAGVWDEVETYLSGFTKLDDNRHSTKIFFEIRKQKYLEALDRQDIAKAAEILYNDLAFVSTSNEGVYKEITLLLNLPNFRLNPQLSTYGNTQNARSIVLGEVKRLIEANPLFREKLMFPTLSSSRLRTLINQSLNWQHSFCKNPRPNTHIKTLFTDHTCPNPNGGAAANAGALDNWMADESADKPQPRQLAEILDPSHCRQLTLPDTTGSSTKVARLLYMNSAVGILALGIDGIQRLWKWVKIEENPRGKATTNVAPQLWQPDSGLLMTNDVSRVNLKGSTPCIALAKNDSYVMSAVGGTASLFNMVTFEVMTKFLQRPPASTFLAFYPQDQNIIAIGMEDSMIHIYNLQTDVIIAKLNGHKERITGLAFSTTLNILVSSGADAQLSVWSLYTWEKRKSVAIQMPAGKPASGDTRVQFHVDQIHVLAVHETQLAIFDASKMNCVRRWIPQDSLSAPISSAVFACNSKLIYTAFRDGNIGVFDADSLRLRCRISPSAYFPQGSQGLSPLVVAANPKDPNQFAIALNDGSIKVIEPTEAEAM
ncbi:unnamed protein product [Arabis nemorensis]|uniref:CTLH domain-containing protein n=1 Tax=Arabis nemorensis TaxID=586526 RepID=A0A565CNC6_9BRAS|nr:unnamed protein product [Arabis nemorensis]